MRHIDREETPFQRVERLRKEKKHATVMRARKASRTKGQVRTWEL